MRMLFRENRVISSIGAELDHKSCWEILSDPQIAGRHFDARGVPLLSAPRALDPRAVRPLHLAPFGRDGDLLEFSRRGHETLVLKPSRGYGGDGVLIGQHA